jgi:hypothetical protein
MKKSTKLAMLALSIVLLGACDSAVESPADIPIPVPNRLSTGSWGSIKPETPTSITELTTGKTYIVKADSDGYRAVSAKGKLSAAKDIDTATNEAVALETDVNSITDLVLNGVTYDVIMVIKESAELTDSETYKDTYVPTGKTLTIGAGVTLTMAANSTLNVKGTFTNDSGDKVIATATGAKILDKNANIITTTENGADAAGIAALLGQLNVRIETLIIPAEATLTVPVSLVSSGTIVAGSLIVDGTFAATGAVEGNGIVKTGAAGKIIDADADLLNITTNNTGITGDALNTCISIFTSGSANFDRELPTNAILNVVGTVTIPSNKTLTVAAGAEIVIGAGGQITLTASNPASIVLTSAVGSGAKLSFTANADKAAVVSTGVAEITVTNIAGTTTGENLTVLNSTPTTVKSIQANSTGGSSNITIRGGTSAGELKTATIFKTS